MVLSRSRVSRGVVLLEPDSFGVLVAVALVIVVAIVRCTRCGARLRALPCDVLPRKTYGLAIIELLVADYARGDRGLRQVAWSVLGDRTPAHATLHGWTEGLGAHALGRPGGDAGGAPLSRFVAEAEARLPEVAATMRADVVVDPRRHRSEARRDRLVAVVCVMTLIQAVADTPHPHAAATCRRLALRWSTSSVLAFRSRLPCTSIEHRGRSMPPGSRSAPSASRDPCLTRTRSPPGASSRSHP